MKNIDKLFKIVSSIAAVPRDEFVEKMESAIREHQDLKPEAVKEKIENLSANIDINGFFNMLFEESSSDSSSDLLRQSIDNLRISVDRLNENLNSVLKAKIKDSNDNN